MKTLILDDEKNARESIELILRKLCPEVTEIQQATTITEAHKIVQVFKPQIAIVDIQLELGTGFDFIEHYLPNPPFQIIFCTAHEKYSLQAFDYQPIHYLLKPLHTTKLISAIKKVQQNSQHTTNSPKEIIIHQTEGTYIPLKIDTIIYIESEANYSILYCSDGKNYKIRKTLTELEIAINSAYFKRVHKSYIVNRNYIVEYHKTDNFLRLRSPKSTLVSVSREKIAELMNWLSQTG